MKSISGSVSESKMETMILNDCNYEHSGFEFLLVVDSSKNEFDGTSEVFTDIIDDLLLGYFNLVVIHQESNLMSLVFEDEKSVYRMCFPSGYPTCPPEIFASNDDGGCYPIEVLLEWRND
jgi:hypothetical protein